MRTTLDIPDAVFKKVKLKAVEEGVPLKDVVTRALEKEVRSDAVTAKERRERARRLFSAFDRARNTRPVGRLKREELYDRAGLRGH
jgi:hypothetical protein